MMDDMERLIAAVEVGAFDATPLHNTPFFNAFANAFELVLGNKPSYMDGWRAYSRSLDSARRLHDALLPGWVVENLGNACIDGSGGWRVWLTGPEYFENFQQASAENGCPARAWLLAILQAKNVMQEAEEA